MASPFSKTFFEQTAAQQRRDSLPSSQIRLSSLNLPKLLPSSHQNPFRQADRHTPFENPSQTHLYPSRSRPKKQTNNRRGRSIIIWWFLWGPCLVAWRIKGKSTYAPTPFGFQDVNKDVFFCSLERREGIFVSICSGIPGRLLFSPTVWSAANGFALA